MAFSVLNLAIAPHLVEAKEMSSVNSENIENQNTLEVLATVDSAALNLLDKIPMKLLKKE